ncbi:unnamed protein product, partial [Musa banksii]
MADQPTNHLPRKKKPHESSREGPKCPLRVCWQWLAFNANVKPFVRCHQRERQEKVPNGWWILHDKTHVASSQRHDNNSSSGEVCHCQRSRPTAIQMLSLYLVCGVHATGQRRSLSPGTASLRLVLPTPSPLLFLRLNQFMS